jgi:hypothetical protein
LMHPVEHLDAPVRIDIDLCRVPAVINDDRTHWCVQATALGTLATRPPGRVYRADKRILPSVCEGSATATSPMRRSVSTSDSFSLIVTTWQRPDPSSSGYDKGSAPRPHNAAVTALISV